MTMNQSSINGIRGCTKTIEGKTKVFLSYEDVLNKLGLIHYNKVPNQQSVISIDNKDQYSYEPVIDWNKINIYAAITNIVNQDSNIVTYLSPNPLDTNNYIPSELAIELSRQCRNRIFEMELIQQIIPGFEPQQSHIKHNTPLINKGDMFAGSANQIDNAERLYLAYKDTIRYVRDMKEIAVYQPTYTDEYGSGGKWFIADYEYLNPMIKELANLLISQAHTEEEKRIANSLKTSYNNSMGIVKSLSAINESLIDLSDFDKYPYLLNVLNGVIDLRNGKFMTTDPRLNLAQQAPVAYNPYARSPVFEEFIASVLPDLGTRNTILRYLGYCLTGDTSAQKALFIIGSGANGKSTLLNVLSRLLGPDYATSVPMNLFNNRVIRTKSETTPDRAKLLKKRFAQVDEIKAGEVLDAGEFKLLTGSDAIPFRDLYQRATTITAPTHKFIFSGNFFPELKDNRDYGTTRRIMVAEFTQRFGPDDIDPDLSRKLTTPESLSGILNILVDQAIQYYKYGVSDSPAMTDIKDEYISGLAKIVRSILAYDSDSYVLTSDLKEEINRIIFPSKLKQGQLKQIMSKLGYESPVKIKFRTEDRDRWAYKGIKLISK